MKKIVLSFLVLVGSWGNAQQLLEVLKSNNTFETEYKAQLWDKTHYVISFNHSGANIDGTLSNTGYEYNALKLGIPYNEAIVGKSYDEVNISQTVVDRFGNNQTLTLHIPAGTFSRVSGLLPATIKVGNGTTDIMKVKQLNANEEELIASFNLNMGGRTGTIKLIANGGILDRNFDKLTDGELKHQFVYMPMSVNLGGEFLVPHTGKPYERTFLMTNLGAEVSNINSPMYWNDGECKRQGVANFFPVNKPSCFHSDDPVIFSLREELFRGSLFQWQRPADGHELVKWKLVDLNRGIYDPQLSPTTSVKSTNPDWIAGHGSFIQTNSYSGNPDTWVTRDVNNNSNKWNLWQKNSTNNPCPMGYYVPTKEDWEELRRTYLTHDYLYYYSGMGKYFESIKPHFRYSDGGYEEGGIRMGFWSSTPSEIGMMGYAFIEEGHFLVHYVPNIGALPIRCIREE